MHIAPVRCRHAIKEDAFSDSLKPTVPLALPSLKRNNQTATVSTLQCS